MIYVPFIFPYWLNDDKILTHWAKYNLLLKFISHVPFYLFCNVATRKFLIVCVVHIIFSFDSAALEFVMLEFWFCWFCFVCGLLSVVMKVRISNSTTNSVSSSLIGKTAPRGNVYYFC